MGWYICGSIPESDNAYKRYHEEKKTSHQDYSSETAILDDGTLVLLGGDPPSDVMYLAFQNFHRVYLETIDRPATKEELAIYLISELAAEADRYSRENIINHYTNKSFDRDKPSPKPVYRCFDPQQDIDVWKTHSIRLSKKAMLKDYLARQEAAKLKREMTKEKKVIHDNPKHKSAVHPKYIEFLTYIRDKLDEKIQSVHVATEEELS